MNKFYSFLFGVAAVTQFSAQSTGIGINTTNPHPSAEMEVSSNSRGFLIPRLTTSAINTLSSTASEGLIVYDKEQKKFVGWDGTKWQNLGYEEQNTAPYASGISISGVASVGVNLTGNYTYTDAEGNPESGSSYSWNRADSNSGTNFIVITGANTKNYTATTSDIGKFLQFCVVPKSNVGVSPGSQVCSAWFGAIATNSAPTVSSASITGNTNIGATITGTYTYNDSEGDTQNTTASGSTFQWKIADDASGTNLTNATGANNSGATNGTGKTYTLQASETGKFIQYCVKPVANTGTITGTETCSAFSGPIIVLQSGVVAAESFEGGALQPGWNLTSSGADAASGFVNTNSPSNWVPANSPRAVDGTYGYQFGGTSGTTGTLTITSPSINTTTYTNNLTFSMRMAGFSNSAGQGLDSASSDFVKIEYSIDGGTTYSTSSITQGGNSNATWPFSTTGSLSLSYGSTAVSQSQPSSGPNTTNDVSTLRITNIPNTLTNLKFRITVKDSQTAAVDEYWVIDDIKLVAP